MKTLALRFSVDWKQFENEVFENESRDFPDQVFLNYRSKIPGLLCFKISPVSRDGSLEQIMHVSKMAGNVDSAKSRLVWCGF